MKLYNYITSLTFIDRLGIGGIFLMYAFFSTTLSLAKSVLAYGPMITYIGLRMFIAGALLLAYYLIVMRKKIVFKRKQDMIGFFNIALFGICGSYVLSFWALQYLSIAKSAFLLILSPFFTAFFAWIHGFENFTSKKILGLTIGALGTIPILMSKSVDETAFASVFALDIPEILTLISVALYAYSWVEVKKLMNKGYDTSLINGMTMFLGGIATLMIAYFMDGWSQGISPVTNWSSYSIYVASIVAVGTFCFTLYAHVLNRYSPTLVSFFGFSEPFFAAIFGWIFIAEEISWVFGVSLLIVSVGLYLFYQEELQ
jgi:drug/metabolite transporter (DMT)-like permease